MTKLLRALRDWYANKAVLDELERMDDHLLADIGIDRRDISFAVREGIPR